MTTSYDPVALQDKRSKLQPWPTHITANQDPALEFRAAPLHRPHGFETSAAVGWREGTPITWTFFPDVATHEEEPHLAGFSEVVWNAPRLSPDGEPASGREIWRRSSIIPRSPSANA